VNDVILTRAAISWQRLVVYPLFALTPPIALASSLTTVLKKQIADFLDSSGLPPYPLIYGAKQKNTTGTTRKNLKYVINAQLSEYNIKGAVRTLSSSATPVSPSEESFKTMTKKHPQRHPDEDQPSVPNHQNYSFSIGEVQMALKSFPNGSGSGPDGLRPQHLKDATSFSASDAGIALIDNLASLMNIIAETGVHSSIHTAFFGARLIALTKPNGDLRPIAIGCTLRRLCAKMVLALNAPRATQCFGSHQVGVGTRLGSEATVHSVREFIKSMDPNSNKIVMKLDLSNAFNSVRRDAMLRAVYDKMPLIYPLTYASYNRSSNLFFGDYIIKSSCGVQQGDPLGPAVFSIAINEIIQKSDLELNVWYLDDGCIGGEPDHVIEHTKMLVEKFKEIGLNINLSKSEILNLNSTHVNLEDLPGIKVTDDSNWRLLGAPLNSDSIPAFLEEKGIQLEKLLKSSDEIERHQAFLIL
jgi:hypothetical protein